MSLDAGLKQILCDSADCGEILSLPLTVHRKKAPRSHAHGSEEAGWVFVAGTYEQRHYCPQCAGKLLGSRAA